MRVIETEYTYVFFIIFFISARDGISLDAKFNEGNTLLHFAVALDMEDAVIDLLEAGASSTITNKKVGRNLYCWLVCVDKIMQIDVSCSVDVLPSLHIK